MSIFETLQRWLQPLLDPLNEVKTVIQQPLSIHQEAVTTFSNLVGGLYEGPDSFQGDAATAIQSTMQAYLHAEAQFSGASILAGGTVASAGALMMAPQVPMPPAPTEVVLENAAKVSVECGTEITGAVTTAATEMAGETGLDAVTEAVDVASVAQAGLDPVTDIPAVVLTAIDIGLKIGILVALGWSIFQAVQSWIGEMNRLGHITWPPLPSFLDLYGSGSGFSTQGKLTLPEMKIAEELLRQNPDAIRNNKDSDRYEYDDVEIDGKYYTVGIAISKTSPSRIVTTFITYDQ